MYHNVRALGIAAIVTLAAPTGGVASARPQEQEGVIRGRLIGPDSSGLSGARVTIVGTGQTAITDSAGTFLLRHTLSGDQTMELGHLDFETLLLPPIRIPQKTLSVNALLQRRIPAGPQGDSARAAALAQGGRGQDRTPIVILDGVIVNYPRVPGASSNARYPTEVDVISIDILTGNAAMQMYGSRARYGVISIVSCPPATAARGGGCR